MTPMDVARSLQRLLRMEKNGAFGKGSLVYKVNKIGPGHQKTGPTTDQGMHSLAGRLGLSVAFVSQHLALVDLGKLPKVAAEKVEAGDVSFNVAREATRIPDANHRKSVAKRVAKRPTRAAREHS